MTQARLPQAVLVAGREKGTDEARATAKGPDEGANALQPAAQRSRLMATESAKTRSSASPALPADPLPTEAAVVLATGKRKRVAEAEDDKEAEMDEGTAETHETEPKRKKTKEWRKKKKKKKKIGDHKRRRKARKNQC